MFMVVVLDAASSRPSSRCGLLGSCHARLFLVSAFHPCLIFLLHLSFMLEVDAHYLVYITATLLIKYTLRHVLKINLSSSIGSEDSDELGVFFQHSSNLQ
jgi:hypothetical protein